MSILDTNIILKRMTLRNRLVLAPITTNYAIPDGSVTPDNLTFYARRSKDIGLVIVEATGVQESGCLVPCSLGLWNDAQIPGMKTLVDTIHDNGAKAVIQLNHAGARCAPRDIEKQGFSPSGVRFRPDVDPVVMTEKDMTALAGDFAGAAVRAKSAGFDGVEIHGAHFYLLSQFLSPLTNLRDDCYGGDARGRAEFPIQVVRRTRELVGSDYPIFFRLNAVERIKGGQTTEDALLAGKLLADAGVDVLDVSLISQGSWKEVDDKIMLAGASSLPKDKPPGANVDLARQFKDKTNLPVIAVGKFGMGNADAAEKAVGNHQIDMIALGRQMICDPGTAGKMLGRSDQEIIGCDECLKCYATIGKGVPMACKINKNLPC